MPSTTAAILNRKRSLSGSEALAYSRNRYEDRTLKLRVRNISEQAQVSHDRHQREIIQWRSFRRESKKHSGAWDQPYDVDHSDWPTTPKLQQTQKPPFSDVDDYRDPKFPQPMSFRALRARTPSVTLARSLSFQSEALTKLQKPWALAYTSESHNTLYSEALQLAREQEKRLYLRRASSAAPSRPTTGLGLESPYYVTERSSILKFPRRKEALASSPRPQTGRSTPGLSLRAKETAESNGVKVNRPKTSNGVIRAVDSSEGLRSGQTTTSGPVSITVTTLETEMNRKSPDVVTQTPSSSSRHKEQPNMRKVASLPVLESQMSQIMEAGISNGARQYKILAESLPAHSEENLEGETSYDLRPNDPDLQGTNLVVHFTMGLGDDEFVSEAQDSTEQPPVHASSETVPASVSVVPTPPQSSEPEPDPASPEATESPNDALSESEPAELKTESSDSNESARPLPSKQTGKRVSISEHSSKGKKMIDASKFSPNGPASPRNTNGNGATQSKKKRKVSIRDNESRDELRDDGVDGGNLARLTRSNSAVNTQMVNESTHSQAETDRKRPTTIRRNSSAQSLTSSVSQRRSEKSVSLTYSAKHTFALNLKTEESNEETENDSSKNAMSSQIQTVDFPEQAENSSNGADHSNPHVAFETKSNEVDAASAEVRCQGKDNSQAKKDDSCPPMAGRGQQAVTEREADEGSRGDDDGGRKSDSKWIVAKQRAFSWNQGRRNTATSLLVHLNPDRIILNGATRSVSAAPSAGNPKTDVSNNKLKTPTGSELVNELAVPDADNNSGSEHKSSVRRPSSYKTERRSLPQVHGSPRPKSHVDQRSRKEADNSENEAAASKNKASQATEDHKSSQPFPQSPKESSQAPSTKDHKYNQDLKAGKEGNEQTKDPKPSPLPQRPETSLGSQKLAETDQDNDEFLDGVSCYSGDSDFTVYRGFPIRNYVRPQERYKGYPFMNDRRERQLLRLTMENPVYLHGHRNDQKSEVVFPKKARRKVLQELVEKNTTPAKRNDKGVVPPELRAKIDEFFKTLEPLCPKPDLVPE